MKAMYYSRETQYVLAELQREGFRINERIANFVEGRHRRGEPTGYSDVSQVLNHTPI